MAYKTSLNYSPNFDSKKRKKNQIKFIIFHYTGMKSEKAAIKKLTNFKSEVSCNYFIKKNGEIITMVPDLYIAWHAGKSLWKKYQSLNKNSIGIEISNPGHEHGYNRFSNYQIRSLIKLSRFLISKYKINSNNILGHSDIAPERKKDPGEKFPWEYLAKKNISFWHNLNKKLLYKNRKIKIDSNQKKIFIKNLIKIGYQIQKSKKLDSYSEKNLNLITKAFQRRFRQDLISGIIDKECLIISYNLVKKLN
ncbi:N-acetylmuramoyl-L-alanine amidase [Candidatus Pelagibacter sp.]|jgi:N-acetylmuramoyl-L-alanine amidase|nr:N-acetylmuramoyl-L-alanine amidase [Candidatus Pelagibacter sp.]